MEAVKEITIWEESEYSVPNHTYLLDGDNMIAYIKQSGGAPFFFKTPVKIKRSGRKFQKADISLFEQTTDWRKMLREFVEAAPDLPYIKKVQGSKPNTWYEVNTNEKTCTCSGFTFRGTCKHVKELETAE